MKRRRNESRDLKLANDRMIRRRRGWWGWFQEEIETWLP